MTLGKELNQISQKRGNMVKPEEILDKLKPIIKKLANFGEMGCTIIPMGNMNRIKLNQFYDLLEENELVVDRDLNTVIWNQNAINKDHKEILPCGISLKEAPNSCCEKFTKKYHISTIIAIITINQEIAIDILDSMVM